MKKIFLAFMAASILAGCKGADITLDSKKVLFLAHSTGTNVFEQGNMIGWFDEYNRENGTDFRLDHRIFPKARFYGWQNYPYDYWKIWVDKKGYKFEPSLDRLTRINDLIIWKHCFPGSMIEEDPLSPKISDRTKSMAVYKLQYNALKEAMHAYPNTDFLVWTLAVMREEDLTKDQAERTREFVNWVKDEWDEPGDNIHIWDFYSHETTSEDGRDQSLYLRPEYASEDAHPNEAFNVKTAPYLCERIVEILTEKE